MELKIFKTSDELKEIREEWSELLGRSNNKRVYLSYEWFLCGYEAFHLKDKLYVLVLKDVDGTFQCIAPLVITKKTYRGINFEKIGFLKNAQNPANDFILCHGMEEDCLKIIMGHLCGFYEWDFIDLQMVDDNSLTAIFLKRFLDEKGFMYGIKLNRKSPYICINCTWEEFLKGRSKRFKKSIRNKLNRANKKGIFVEKIVINDGDVPELDVMLEISTNSWKKGTGTDLSSMKNNWSFYKSICDILGPMGIISLWLLKFDNIPVAFEFHVENEMVVYPIRADYDERFKKLSPGSILEHEILKSLFFKNNLQEYNSCGHVYKYLLNWTSETRDYINFEIFKKTILMTILFKFEYEILVALRNMPFFNQLKKILKVSVVL